MSSLVLRRLRGCPPCCVIGVSGAVVTIDGEPVAHAMWGPASHLPGLASYPTTPVSPDAIVLTNVLCTRSIATPGWGASWCERWPRRWSSARMQAIESIAPFAHSCQRGTSRRLIPQDFLLAVGSTHQPGSCYPRMRICVRR
ncbi:MAG: hypothetical protein R2709_10930 [Marmoricola sp.]